MKLLLPHSLRLPGAMALLFAASSSASSGATFIAFGPAQYFRNNGAPIAVTNIFNVVDLSAPFTIHIDSAGVSSAIVTLNGVNIFKQSDFNQTVKVLTKSVTVLAINQLTVELSGKPGERFALQIIGNSSGGITPEQTLLTVANDLSSGNITAALRHFSSSSKNADVLTSLSGNERREVAEAFRNATLVDATPRLRVYTSPFVEPGGTTLQLRFTLGFRTDLNEWFIVSW